MIFGGARTYISQISEVTGCSLRRVGDLPIDFRLGGCNTFNSASFAESEEILLCFSFSSQKECHR